MQYVPVLTGEATMLRQDIQGILDGNNPEGVRERIRELDEATQRVGALATFGAEIEYCFVSADGDPTGDRNALYQELVQDLNGGLPDTDEAYKPKGAVVLPDSSEAVVMVNDGCQANTDGQPGITEVRVLPGQAVTAEERYWQTLNAINEQAYRHGLRAHIFSSQFSSAVVMMAPNKDGVMQKQIMPYSSGSGFAHVAATQAALVAAHPLQTGSGLARGVFSNEAFPYTKDGHVTVHAGRLEQRPATLGVIDPRLGMLATLHGLHQMVNGTVPKSYTDKTYGVHGVSFESSDKKVSSFMGGFTGYSPSRGFVAPALIQPAGHSPRQRENLRHFWQLATGKEHTNIGEVSARLPEILSSLQLDENGVDILCGSNLSPALRDAMAGAKVSLSPSQLPAVEPVWMSASPKTYRQNRNLALQSPVVQQMLGDAAGAIVSSREADRQRQQFIQNHTIQR